MLLSHDTHPCQGPPSIKSPPIQLPTYVEPPGLKRGTSDHQQPNDESTSNASTTTPPNLFFLYLASHLRPTSSHPKPRPHSAKLVVLLAETRPTPSTPSSF